MNKTFCFTRDDKNTTENFRIDSVVFLWCWKDCWKDKSAVGTQTHLKKNSSVLHALFCVQACFLGVFVVFELKDVFGCCTSFFSLEYFLCCLYAFFQQAVGVSKNALFLKFFFGFLRFLFVKFPSSFFLPLFFPFTFVCLFDCFCLSSRLSFFVSALPACCVEEPEAQGTVFHSR